MADFRMTTNKAVRESFWNNNWRLIRFNGRTHNSYSADVRMAFCDHVDMLARDGEISESLAQRATL